jgi:hypothetical protein
MYARRLNPACERKTRDRWNGEHPRVFASRVRLGGFPTELLMTTWAASARSLRRRAVRAGMGRSESGNPACIAHEQRTAVSIASISTSSMAGSIGYRILRRSSN